MQDGVRGWRDRSAGSTDCGERKACVGFDGARRVQLQREVIGWLVVGDLLLDLAPADRRPSRGASLDASPVLRCVGEGEVEQDEVGSVPLTLDRNRSSRTSTTSGYWQFIGGRIKRDTRLDTLLTTAPTSLATALTCAGQELPDVRPLGFEPRTCGLRVRCRLSMEIAPRR
jgi:hypothetical protein